LRRYTKVTLLAQPSSGYFMQKDYKHFSPMMLPTQEECAGNYCELPEVARCRLTPRS
jgi:hypothetical protein